MLVLPDITVCELGLAETKADTPYAFCVIKLLSASAASIFCVAGFVTAPLRLALTSAGARRCDPCAWRNSQQRAPS